MSCKNCELSLKRSNFYTNGPAFYKDSITSENKTIQLVGCSFFSKQLGLDNVWDISSRGLRLIMIETNFYYYSEANFKFPFFLRVRNDSFQFEFRYISLNL